MFKALRRDIRAVLERDPAARSAIEVLLCYPGVHALAYHRLAHRLWSHGWLTTARLVSHMARFMTGIEIHPAAKIAPGLFIDHGMGVVIGETAEVGENVTLLQGVTLGGTSLRREKRHPTERLPGTASLLFRHVESESIVLGLDLKGIGVSAGSACTSGNVELSHVLVAMGVPLDWAIGAVRCSLGRSTTAEDIEYVIECIEPLVRKLRQAMPAGVA